MNHRILKAEQSRNSNLIFVSAGDRETFATYASSYLADRFDVAIFFYGRSKARKSRLEQAATMFSIGKGTKFNSLKQWLSLAPHMLDPYETVWMCDDDVIPVSGDIRSVPEALRAFNMSVVSPAHAANGKISHRIMLPEPGDHVLRCCNFVEMTCPLFRKDALAGFIGEYDGSLAGWGVDWWYLSYLEADSNPVAGVMDNVVFYNPFDREKRGGRREIDRYMSTPGRRRQWGRAKRRYGFHEWPHRNLVSATYSASRITALQARGSRLAS